MSATLQHLDDGKQIGLDEVRVALDERALLPAGAWYRDNFDAHCPHHEDNRPSLSVAIGRFVPVVLHCHAGCSRQNILRDLGLWRELKVHREVLESKENVGGERERALEVFTTRTWTLGIENPYEPFGCVLPGHGHRARIVDGKDEPVRYRCEIDPTRGLSFAEVFRWRLTGRPYLMHGPLACRWFERFEFEAGLLKPTRIAVPVPIGAPLATRRVAEYVRLYLGLRDANAGGYDLDQPFTFARSFCMDYCGVTAKQAQDAMRALEDCGAIARVGTVPIGKYRAILYELGHGH